MRAPAQECRCPQGVAALRGVLVEPRAALDGRAIDIDHDARVGPGTAAS
ncbi:DUF6052 family protein [Streptomyces sp. NPDC051740]